MSTSIKYVCNAIKWFDKINIRWSKEIVIEPFDIECLGSNSYDVHLGPMLLCYNKAQLDSKKDNDS